jgi:lipoprotein-anchoring transpeptidase ErfK/SrfK
LLVVVNVKTQRATVYRNGLPIGATTVSTGKPGHSTPTGVFTILQKQVEHYSSLYDSAPMPYMQRLTWGGVALHAGKLPGYPASHGCIRMPYDFAKLLYGVTKLGMTVVVTNSSAVPRVAPGPELAGPSEFANSGSIEWQPDRATEGPVSIVVSAADQRALVLRNGIVIGSGPVSVSGPADATWAYALRSTDSTGQHWIQLALDGGGDRPVQAAEWRRFRAPDAFRKLVASVVSEGTTVVVTGDSLQQAQTGVQVPVLESEPSK